MPLRLPRALALATILSTAAAAAPEPAAAPAGTAKPAKPAKPPVAPTVPWPAAASPAPASAPRPPATSYADVSAGYEPELDPPPGTKEQVALWKKGYEMSRELGVVKREALRLNRRAHTLDLDKRLAAAARQRQGTEAERLEALRLKLERTWWEHFRMAGSTWPVEPVRGCTYPVMHYDSALRVAADSGKLTDLGTSEADLRTCTERAESTVKAMGGLNKALGEAIEDGLKALAAVEPAAGKVSAAPAAGAVPGPATPAPKQAPPAAQRPD